MAISNYNTATITKKSVFMARTQLTNTQIKSFFPNPLNKHSEYAEACTAQTLIIENLLFYPDLYQGKTVVDRLTNYRSNTTVPGGKKGDTNNGLKSVDGWFWLNHQWIPYDVKSFDITTQGISVDEYNKYLKAHGNVMVFVFDKNKYSKKQTPSAQYPDYITCLSEISIAPQVNKTDAYCNPVTMMDYICNNSPTIEGLFMKNSSATYDLCSVRPTTRFAGNGLCFQAVIDKFIQKCTWP